MSSAPQPEWAPQPSVVRELILTGPPLKLALPDVCARCGEQAAKRLYWEKVGEVSSDDGTTYKVIGSRAPFCAQCLQQHEREVKRMPALMQVLQCFRSQMMIPAALAGFAAVFAGFKLLPNPLSATLPDVLVFCGAVGFLGLISVGSLFAAWRATRWRTVPPLTTITGSFTFGDDISELFERERYRYVMVNDAFFEALLAANRDKIWKPGSAHAHRASWARRVLYVAAAVVVAVVLLWDWIKPWIRVEW